MSRRENLELNRESVSNMKYRSHTDILASMVQSCLEPSTRTMVMYKTFLSHTQLKQNFEFILENKLIKETDCPKGKRIERQHYLTTDKGRTFIHHWNSMNQLLNGVDEAQ